MKYIIDPGNNGELVERVLRRRNLPEKGLKVPKGSSVDSKNLWISDIKPSRKGSKIGFSNPKPWQIFEQQFVSRALKGEWNLIWKLKNNITIDGHRLPLYEIPRLPKGLNLQVVNHFPNSKVLTDKDELSKIKKDYIPRSFKFRISDLKLSGSKVPIGDLTATSSKYLILKPSNLQSGRGIKIFKELHKPKNTDEAIEHINQTVKEHPSVSSWVVQEYIPNPFLYKGRKFDIRVHFLITDTYDIYICRFGFVRINSVPYTKELTGEWDVDKFVHITNHAIQKKHPNFGKDLEYGEKNVITLDDFRLYLESIDSKYNPYIESLGKKSDNLFSKIFEDWKSIIYDLAMTVKSDIKSSKLKIPNRRYFELFGLDILLDENLNSWVLEVNQNPGLDQEISWTGPALEQMIDEVFKLTIDKMFKNHIDMNLRLWEKI